MEPLLTPSRKRFALTSQKTYPDIWEMYKKAEASFWTAEELDISRQDRTDWERRLNDNERHFIKHVLAFFASSDGIVNENLCTNFMNEVQDPDARCFYGFQIAMENIHNEVYQLLLDTYITDRNERTLLSDAIETIPAIQKKAEWALHWIENKSQSFATRLIAFACVEGIHFSGSFCAIFWLRSRNLMPGLCSSNDFINRDEGLHCDFACLLYSKLQYTRLSQKEVEDIVCSAVDIEKEFVCAALPVSLIGMNCDQMSIYIEFIADRLLVALGYAKKYYVTNPFPFMDQINLQGKANFFEKVVSEYFKAGVGVDQSEHQVFKLDEDF